MDFDTERGPEREEGPPQAPDEEPRRTSGDSSTTEFTYTDPVQSYVETVRNLVTQPANFFAGIARQGDFINPLIFALVGVVFTAVITGFLGILGAIVGLGNRGIGGAFGGLVSSIFITPIFFTIALFIGAGIIHLLVMLIVKPAFTGYEASFRILSYSAVGQLVGWIPFLGPLVAAVATVILAIIGVREVHNTTTGKAALVVLIPAAVVIVILIVLALLIGAALFFTLQQ
ncbi:MAG: YIP1 family protein [Rubrobacteraceae bacterium]